MHDGALMQRCAPGPPFSLDRRSSTLDIRPLAGPGSAQEESFRWVSVPVKRRLSKLIVSTYREFPRTTSRQDETMCDQRRRKTIATITGISASTLLSGGAFGLGKKLPGVRRKLGIELYMLGDDVATDPRGTLRQVAEIGYREVEFPHFFNRAPSELAQAVAAAGLSCPSLHATLEPVWPNMPTLQEPDKIFGAAHLLGAKSIVVTIFPFPTRLLRPLRPGERATDMLGDMANNMTPTDWDNVASRLNEAGALVSRNGFRLAYHNHNLEFVKMPDGRTAFDFLVAEMDPALIDLELDVGWVAAAGYDPVAIIRRYGDRIRLVHLRDLAPTPPNNALKANPTDLGQGIVDWAKVLGAINQIQVDHLYVEQEPSIRPSRMQTARVAFNYLKKAFAELSISL